MHLNMSKSLSNNAVDCREDYESSSRCDHVSFTVDGVTEENETNTAVRSFRRHHPLECQTSKMDPTPVYYHDVPCSGMIPRRGGWTSNFSYSIVPKKKVLVTTKQSSSPATTTTSTTTSSEKSEISRIGSSKRHIWNKILCYPNRNHRTIVPRSYDEIDRQKQPTKGVDSDTSSIFDCHWVHSTLGHGEIEEDEEIDTEDDPLRSLPFSVHSIVDDLDDYYYYHSEREPLIQRHDSDEGSMCSLTFLTRRQLKNLLYPI
jgi:hypothetical protein